MEVRFEDVRFNAEFFEIPAHDIKNVLRADKRDDGGRGKTLITHYGVCCEF